MSLHLNMLICVELNSQPQNREFSNSSDQEAI